MINVKGTGRKEALAATDRAGKMYASQLVTKTIQRSSVVERSAVNRLVVGSNPTAGANFSMDELLRLRSAKSRWQALHRAD